MNSSRREPPARHGHGIFSVVASLLASLFISCGVSDPDMTYHSFFNLDRELAVTELDSNLFELTFSLSANHRSKGTMSVLITPANQKDLFYLLQPHRDTILGTDVEVYLGGTAVDFGKDATVRRSYTLRVDPFRGGPIGVSGVARIDSIWIDSFSQYVATPNRWEGFEVDEEVSTATRYMYTKD